MQFTGCDQPVEHSHWPEAEGHVLGYPGCLYKTLHKTANYHLILNAFQTVQKKITAKLCNAAINYYLSFWFNTSMVRNANSDH